MAQSSVTLYGVADTGVTYTSGKENVYGLTHLGGNTNSRLGFRGVEDLGGGLKATFQLEAGVGIDDGTDYFTGSGMAFRRISKLGLEGGFGAVSLGRELTASYMAVSRYDVFGDTGIGGSLAWKNGYDARTQNAISSTPPSAASAGINTASAASQSVTAVTLAWAWPMTTAPSAWASAMTPKQRGPTAVHSSCEDPQDLSTWQLGGPTTWRCQQRSVQKKPSTKTSRQRCSYRQTQDFWLMIFPWALAKCALRTIPSSDGRVKTLRRINSAWPRHNMSSGTSGGTPPTSRT